MTARPRPSIGVFAVEDTTAQLTWRGMAAGSLHLRAAGTGVAADLEVEAGPGAIVLAGLPPDRTITIHASGSALAGHEPATLHARTLPSLPGEELFRLATISDLHLGARGFGHRGTIVEPVGGDLPHPFRCATAAVEDAARWGAQRLVVKGDTTNRGAVDEWRAYAGLVAAAPFPVDAIPGNHDRGYRPATPGLVPEEAAAVFGLSIASPLLIRDVPGLRVVLLDSTTAGRNRGHVASLIADAVDATRDAGPAGSVLIVLHHQLHRYAVAEGWPLGVDHAESRDLLERLGAVHPRVLVTSGHTHRHRRWDHAGTVSTQVGSTKDFPGVWAGYVAHEGGLRQVVRRVERPDCLAWTDQTRRAAFGVWRWVAPGRLSSRCFTVTGNASR